MLHLSNSVSLIFCCLRLLQKDLSFNWVPNYLSYGALPGSDVSSTALPDTLDILSRIEVSPPNRITFSAVP